MIGGFTLSVNKIKKLSRILRELNFTTIQKDFLTQRVMHGKTRPSTEVSRTSRLRTGLLIS